MSGPSQKEVCEEVVAMTEQREREQPADSSEEVAHREASEEVAAMDDQQDQQQPTDRSEEVVAMVDQPQPEQQIEEVAPPVTPTRSAKDARTASTLTLEQWEGELDIPVLGRGRWVVADARSGALQTEPAKSNLARAHTLLRVAQELGHLLSSEEKQLEKLQVNVEALPHSSALAKMRLWAMERSFHRRVRTHLEQVRRQNVVMLDVFGHFDTHNIERKTGGPAVRLLEDLPSESSSVPSAPPAASSTSHLHKPDEGQCGDSGAQLSAEAKAETTPDEQDVAKVGEVGATAISSSSSEIAGAAAEEVAAASGAAAEEVAAASGAAAEEVAAASGAVAEEVAPRHSSPMPWKHHKFEKKRSSSSSVSRSNDSLKSNASALRDTSSLASSAAAAMDTLLASVDVPEASAATVAFGALRQLFLDLTHAVREHLLVGDSVLNQEESRGQLPLAEDGVEDAEELPPMQQRLLMHDVQLVLSQISSTQIAVSRREAALQAMVDALPPAPTSPPRGGLAKFSQILKKRFSRTK